MANTFESAKDHSVLHEALKALVINQFCDDYDYLDQRIHIDISNLIKAGWLASILAESPEESHQFIAGSFAKLLYLQYSTDEQKTKLAYTILSRIGNLAAARHLHNIFEDDNAEPDKKFKSSFGIELDFELGVKRDKNKLLIDNKPYFVTDFQRKLWYDLKKFDKVAISAPTSAGKSFFTQHFIASLFRQCDQFIVVYIVPTKALISQVSEDFKGILDKDVTIRTSFIDDVEFKEKIDSGSKKEVYCVTPERCLKLLQQGWNGLFTPDLVFVDEIQNVGLNDNRGVLLEYIISQIAILWKNSKILFAGPFIINGIELYQKLLNISANEINSYLPAVYQLRVTLKLQPQEKIEIIIHLFGNNTHSFTVPFNFKLKKSAPNKDILAPIVKRFGKNDRNLIYAAKPNWCVEYAMQFITEIGKENKPVSIDPSVQDLIDLLKEEIHPNYYLIYCLGYKVAFHHGKLPDVVRNEIEYLFLNNHIEYLFCTSTLLQGVNLPAPRMFIITPTKNNSPLSSFEFGNLIGRAGRVRDSMIGTIFCLEKNNETDSWSKKYFNAEYTKKVIPATEVALTKEITQIIETLDRQPQNLNHSGEEYTNNLIKQRYIQNPVEFNTFLNEKITDQNKIKAISEKLSAELDVLSIPADLVRLNPNIDPILQNKLYEKIKQSPIEEWVLIDDENGNENYRAIMHRIDAEKLVYSKWNFYFQFERLLEKLDDIFAIWKEAYIQQVPMNAKKMAFYGVTWLDSMTYAQLINKELGYYKEKDDEILDVLLRLKKTNERINRVFNVNSTIVTYLLVKYFKLLADILDSLMTDDQKKLFKRTLSLPTMLELGTRKIEVLIMISLGIPRSIALNLAPLIPIAYKERPLEWLITIKDLNNIKILKKYYIRYLYRKGYLPNLIRSESMDISKTT